MKYYFEDEANELLYFQRCQYDFYGAENIVGREIVQSNLPFVILNNGDIRDMLGHVCSDLTEKGRQFYLYKLGELDLDSLKTEFFSDDDFYKGVLMEEKVRARELSKNKNVYSLIFQHIVESVKSKIDDKREKALALRSEKFRKTEIINKTFDE